MTSDLTPRSQTEPRRGFLQHAAVAVATGSLGSAASNVEAAMPSDPAARSSLARAAADHRTFNAGNTALVLVDHQIGTIGWAAELSTEDERNQLKMWVRVMARFARSAGIPTVLTSSLESESQGPLLPEFKEILPLEYDARIQRRGVINAWDDPAFVMAIAATRRRNLLMGGLTTDVCLVPPALSAQEAGYQVVALLDISAACTRLGGENSRRLLEQAGVAVMSVTPMITSMLGNYKDPASAGFFEAFAKEGVYAAFGRGGLR